MNVINTFIEGLVVKLRTWWDNGVMSEPQQTVQPQATPAVASTPIVPTNLIDTFLSLIQEYEGWIPPGVNPDYPKGSPAYVNNNPGNIRCNAIMATLATGCSPEGFCIFPSETVGMQQLKLNTMKLCLGTDVTYNQIAKQKYNLSNANLLTLQQFFTIRDPSSDDNDPNAYAKFVGDGLKVDYTTFTMKQLL